MAVVVVQIPPVDRVVVLVVVVHTVPLALVVVAHLLDLVVSLVALDPQILQDLFGVEEAVAVPVELEVMVVPL